MIETPQFNIPKEDWVEGKLLYGKNLSKKIQEKIKILVQEKNLEPSLAVLLVGEDEASHIYVSHKKKAASKVGFKSTVKYLSKNATQEEVLAQVHEWNIDPSIHGILVQLPLPKHLNTQNILQSIIPRKDVDGFHFENIGRLSAREQGVVPCTPMGIIIMLKELNIDTVGKHAVVVGRSNIVGKPMANLLMDVCQCTTTICHSKTENLSSFIKAADILVAAIGVRNVVREEDIKKGAIVFDVGMHRDERGLHGDINYKNILDKVSYVTPVPGGVGPMTIAMLLSNTYKNSLKEKQDSILLA